MDFSFIDELKENSEYLQEIAPNFWLMDDHRWAFYVWEKARAQNNSPYTLVHLDFHYDGVNDFQEPDDRERLASVATENKLLKLVEDKDHIRYDSFIAPAVIRGLIKEIHFYCKQSEEDSEPGTDSDILEENNCSQFFYTDIEELVSSVHSGPILFDLCLDLFNKDNNKMYEGTLWKDAEIISTLDVCQSLVTSASVVTISLSFGYSGTEEQTRHLASIAIPKCLSYMNGKIEI
jgi:hypothetical protein